MTNFRRFVFSNRATDLAALADACETVKAAYDKPAVAPAYSQSVAMQGMPTMHMVTIGDTLYMDQGEGT